MPAPVIALLRGFRTTHWTLIRRAETDDHAATLAREQLCRDYWFPIYLYLRKRGYNHNAEDLTQDFLADVLQRPWLTRADENKGKFRSFLLSSLDFFLSNAADRKDAQKREGPYLHVPLDAADAELRYSRSRTLSVDPGTAYEVQWAATVVANAMARLEEECIEAGKQAQFDLLKTYLKGEGDAAGYEAAAAGMNTTVANVKVRVHRLRQRYGVLLKEEVSRTVAGPEEIVEEMRHLRAMFSTVVPI